MGEIADMMLDGTLCAGCGVYLGSGNDFPTYCRDCGPDFGTSESHPDTKIPCKICKKRIKNIGLKDHMRDAHGVKS